MGVISKLAKTPPAVLHHYTNQNGMLGIVLSDSLWATKIQYLNDSTEYLYTVDLADELLKERLATEKNEREKKKIGGMRRDLQGISHMTSAWSLFRNLAIFLVNGVRMQVTQATLWASNQLFLLRGQATKSLFLHSAFTKWTSKGT